MSVLLSWENPESTFLPATRYMRVERGINHNILTTDSPWGVFEDVGGIDVNETYCVYLLDGLKNELNRIDNVDIRRFVRPTNVCKIKFELKNPNGSPASGRKIRISSPANSEFSQIVCCNYNGKAEAFFVFGQRIIIEISGNKHNLDCIIPSVQETTWPELIPNGSWVLAELRGMVP